MTVIRLSILILIIASCSSRTENSFSDPRDGEVYTFSDASGFRWMTEDLVYIDKDIYNSGAWIWNCEETDFEGSKDCPHANECVLYDWYTANNSCPEGWHLPSRSEWKELIGHYSSAESAYPSFSGFNLSFDGRARVFNEFCLFDGNTFWTSDTDYDDNIGISVAIQFSSDGELVSSFEESIKDNGFYVRCIQNTEE